MRLARRFSPRILLSCALSACAGIASADTIHLTDGRVLEGSIIWHADRRAVDIHITSTGIDAIITVPAAQVVRIDPGPGPHQRALAEIQSRMAALNRDSSSAQYLMLAQKARAIGDDTLARMIVHDLLAIDPTNAEAHSFLGEQLVNGIWMTVPEAMAARGWVLYQDRWMPQAEADRLQAAEAQQRAQEDAARHEREEQQAAPTASGYIDADLDSSGYGSDGFGDSGNDMGAYDMGGWPWWYGGAVVIGHHHMHHGHGGGGFRGGFGSHGVRAGGFGAVVGGRR